MRQERNALMALLCIDVSTFCNHTPPACTVYLTDAQALRNVLGPSGRGRCEPPGMYMRHTCKKLIRLFFVAAFGAIVGADVAIAALQDSRLQFSEDGVSVEFEIRDTPRREVIAELFAGTGIELKWVEPSFAEGRITGTFIGPRFTVARELLAQTNLVVVHNGAEISRVTRVIIVGRATGERSFTGLAALATVFRSVHGAREPGNGQLGVRGGEFQERSPDAPGTRAETSIALPELRHDLEAIGLRESPAPGASAPRLRAPPAEEVPLLFLPSQSDAASLLIPPGSETTAPPLRPR